MTSKNIYEPYFYIIKHKPSGKLYAGCKYARNSNPKTFMTSLGYKTSQNTIKKLINEDGLESFEIVTILIEKECGCHVHEYETRFLIENNCAKNEEWINCHNNNQVSTRVPLKGWVVAKNINTGETIKIQKHLFDSSDEWVSPNLGLKRQDETKRNISEAHKGYIPSEETKLKLREQSRHKVPVKNINTGETKRVSVKEFECISSEWVATQKGRITPQSTKEKLKEQNKNKVTAKHKITGEIKSISKEEFDSSGEWVSPNLGLKRSPESREKMRLAQHKIKLKRLNNENI